MNRLSSLLSHNVFYYQREVALKGSPVLGNLIIFCRECLNKIHLSVILLLAYNSAL
jgi:hypothetical protein